MSQTHSLGYTVAVRAGGILELPVDQGEDVEHSGHIGVDMARGLLQVLQSLLAQGHRHLIPALGSVLDHQVMQGTQAGGDLIPSLLGGNDHAAVLPGDWDQQRRTETHIICWKHKK